MYIRVGGDILEYKEIGTKIRERRQEMNMSVFELANRLRMSKATIHRYESGDIKTIKLPVIESIARELRCNPAWLIGKSDRKETANDAHGNPRYNDVIKLLDDIIQFVGYAEELTCFDERLKSEDKRAVITGLTTIRDMTISRYKK